MSCIICKKVVQNEEKVPCNVCKVNCAHANCIKGEVSKPKPGRKPKWVCAKCKLERKDLGSDLSEDEEKKASDIQMMQILTEIQQKITKIDKIEEKVIKINEDTSKIDDLKSSVDFLSAKYDEVLLRLEKQDVLVKSMSKELKEVSVKLAQRDSEVEELTARVHQLEQSRLAMNVEIHGLPATAGENTMELADKLAKVIGAPPAASCVEDCYRIPNNPNNMRKQNVPPIFVVKFKSNDARRLWFDRKKTRNLTVANVLGGDNNNKIFICEQLTPDLKRLFFNVRSAAKERNVKFVWVKDGKILVRKSEDTGTARIRSENDIDRRMSRHQDSFRVGE